MSVENSEQGNPSALGYVVSIPPKDGQERSEVEVRYSQCFNSLHVVCAILAALRPEHEPVVRDAEGLLVDMPRPAQSERLGAVWLVKQQIGDITAVTQLTAFAMMVLKCLPLIREGKGFEVRQIGIREALVCTPIANREG